MIDAIGSGRSGRPDGVPGLRVRQRDDLTFASLIVARGGADALHASARAAFAVELPGAGRVSSGSGLDFIWSGPGRWLVQATRGAAPDIETLLAPLTAYAAVCDQGDSRLVLDIDGPRVREVLAKGLPLDLDATVFTTGYAASSTISYIGVQIWQLAADPCYRVLVTRSYAGSFCEWLRAAAAEYGCCVDAAPPAG